MKQPNFKLEWQDYEVRLWSGRCGTISLIGEDLAYATIGETYEGLQCHYLEGHENYDKIKAECRKIHEAIKEINKLNKL